MKNRSNRPPVLAWVMLVLVVGLLAGGCAWRIVESGRADTLPGIALAVLGDKPLPYGVEDSILQMRVLDAIFASEKSGGWAKV